MILISIFLILVLHHFCDYFPQENDQTYVDTTRILIPDTSVHYRANIIAAHNSLLISALQVNLSMDNSYRISQESIKMQIRLFYGALLIGLISVFYATARRKKPLLIIVPSIILVFMGYMYLLEIHRNDLDKRSISAFYIKAGALNSLLNSAADNSRWYLYAPGLITKHDSVVSLPEHRWPRKAYAAFNPDLEQIAFYLIPALAFYLILIFQICTRRALPSVLRDPEVDSNQIKIPFSDVQKTG